MYVRRLNPVIVFAAFALFSSACAHGPYLNTLGASPTEVSGRYTLFLHGGRYAADLQNVAVLDIEGDPYTFEIYAPEFDYRIIVDLPAEEAVREAGAFVRRHYAAVRSDWRKILAPGGEVIGYEVRPVYSANETGYPDILDITYTFNERKVTARITFKPEIERSILNEEKGPFIFRRLR